MKTRRTLALIALLASVSPLTLFYKIAIAAPAAFYLLIVWDEWSYENKKRLTLQSQPKIKYLIRRLYHNENQNGRY